VRHVAESGRALKIPVARPRLKLRVTAKRLLEGGWEKERGVGRVEEKKRKEIKRRIYSTNTDK
jgi:hypothetical protein